MKSIKVLALSALIALTAPVHAMTCYYSTHIDNEDLYNSAGKKLTTIGQILAQDRANLYTGIGENDHDGYDWDNCRLDNVGMRKELQRIIDKSKISPATKNAIKRGGSVPIRIEITEGVATIHMVK